MVVRLPQHCFCHSVAVVCPDSATDAPPCNAYDPSWLGSPLSRFGQGEFQDMRWILGGGWARRDLARCGLSRVQENKLHTERASACALFTLMTLGGRNHESGHEKKKKKAWFRNAVSCGTGLSTLLGAPAGPETAQAVERQSSCLLAQASCFL